MSTGWGAANANGKEQAVNLPKQGFSLNFVRPASKSKVSLANAPPPLATPVEVPSEPTRTTPADSQQGQVSSEARAEPLGKMETVVPSTLPLEGRIASSLLIRDEQSEGRPLPAQPATAPDNKSDAILAEVEVPKAGQHFEAGSEVNAAFVDVKDEQQSPADEEEEGPPGDDGPPGGETFDKRSRILRCLRSQLSALPSHFQPTQVHALQNTPEAGQS